MKLHRWNQIAKEQMNPNFARQVIHAERITCDWIDTYHTFAAMPIDSRFEQHIRLMLLERCIGSVLVDLTVADRPPAAETTRGAHCDALARLAHELIDEL